MRNGGNKAALKSKRSLGARFHFAVMHSRRLAKRWVTTGTLGLLVSGAKAVRPMLPIGKALGSVLGVVAPAIMAVGSLSQYRNAKHSNERLDGIHGMLWATQAGAEWIGGAANHVAPGFGIAGGSLQIAVGLRRIRSGWKSGNRRDITSGVLDTVAGGAWILTAVNVALPVSMSVFIGSTLLKMAHENRAPIARASSAIRNLLQGATASTRLAVN